MVVKYTSVYNERQTDGDHVILSWNSPLDIKFP